MKLRSSTDPIFKIRKLVRSAVAICLRRNLSSKGGKSIKNYLPYTIEELKEHLENQFESWMNWTNHGSYKVDKWNDDDSSTWTWQIDHIIPHSTFKYTSMEDQAFRDCWALSNLRPLSSKQNLLDGATKIRHRK